MSVGSEGEELAGTASTEGLGLGADATTDELCEFCEAGGAGVVHVFKLVEADVFGEAFEVGGEAWVFAGVDADEDSAIGFQDFARDGLLDFLLDLIASGGGRIVVAVGDDEGDGVDEVALVCQLFGVVVSGVDCGEGGVVEGGGARGIGKGVAGGVDGRQGEEGVDFGEVLVELYHADEHVVSAGAAIASVDHGGFEFEEVVGVGADTARDVHDDLDEGVFSGVQLVQANSRVGEAEGLLVLFNHRAEVHVHPW